MSKQADIYQSSLLRLPTEVLRLIFEFSDPKERAQIALTCHLLGALIQDLLLKKVKVI